MLDLLGLMLPGRMIAELLSLPDQLSALHITVIRLHHNSHQDICIMHVRWPLADLRLYHEGPQHHVNMLQVVPGEDAFVPKQPPRGAPLSPWLQDLLQDPGDAASKFEALAVHLDVLALDKCTRPPTRPHQQPKHRTEMDSKMGSGSHGVLAELPKLAGRLSL